MDQSDAWRPKPPRCVLVSDPVQIAGIALLQALDQARRQLERRLDWVQIETRQVKLVQRLEAGLKLLSLQQPADDRLCSVPLLEALRELTVEASVAAEAGQWRWAWSTATVLAKLRHMRADLKRAFALAAAEAAATSSESSQADEASLQPHTPPLASPRRRRSSIAWTPLDLLTGEPLEGDWVCQPPQSSSGAGGGAAVGTALTLGTYGLEAQDFEAAIVELAAGLRLRPIRVGQTC